MERTLYKNKQEIVMHNKIYYDHKIIGNKDTVSSIYYPNYCVAYNLFSNIVLHGSNANYQYTLLICPSRFCF